MAIARPSEYDANTIAEGVSAYVALCKGSNYRPTIEGLAVQPRVRHALALRKLGREAEAREVLSDVVKRIGLAPRYVRKTQAEWLALAGQALKM